MTFAPLKNAADTSLLLNSGTMPDLQSALLNWFQRLTFTKVVKTIVNFQVVETKTDYTFLGLWQPFTAQQLMIKPEGQRQWKWFTCHAFPDLILMPDEIVTFAGTSYRVMEKLDWTLNGFVEYHVIENYTT